MHGDAHPGNFMLIGDKMGVIDFGAVAPLPGGMPANWAGSCYAVVKELRQAAADLMEQIGFIQKGERVSTDDVDDMLSNTSSRSPGVPLQPQVAAADGHHRHGQGRRPESRRPGR